MTNNRIATPSLRDGRPCSPEGEWQAALEGFARYLQSRDYSDATVNGRRKQARRFIGFLVEAGVGPAALDRRAVSDYWAECGGELSHSSMQTVRSSLVAFLGYLGNNGISEPGLEMSLPSVVGRVTRIKRVYGDDEIRAALDAIDRDRPPGRRDYAMILLGSATALRALDIIRVKVADIDWERDEIMVMQHKSRKLRAVPLGAEAGNAIADYLLNERPESGCPYLFLTCQEPYKAFSDSSAAAGILRKRLVRAGVDVSDRPSGFHSFRVRAASRLLSEGTPLPNISEYLGHANPKSVKPYIAVDEAEMRSCCLPLDGIGAPR